MLRNITDQAKFKRKLKHFLFTNSYDSYTKAYHMI